QVPVRDGRLLPGRAVGGARAGCRSLAGAALGAPTRDSGLDFVTSASMATWLTTATRTASLFMAVALAVTLNACTPKPNGPEPIACKFCAAWATGDTAAAAELSDKPADARSALNEAWARLQ